MRMRPATRRAACLGTGLTMLAAGVVGFLGASSADAAGAGSRFGSLGLIGEAGGARILDRASGQAPGTFEGDTPFSQVSLTLSGGRAFASVAWPGGFVGNLGSTYTLLTGQTLPTDANSPVRAETQTGSGPPTEKVGAPGATMFASAKPAAVIADAVFGPAQKAGANSLGTTHSHATGMITGAHSAVTQSSSTTEDISLGSGAITIGSVTSFAKVATDGHASAGSGRTTVSDMRVGGVPVTVDKNGVHAQGQGTPLDPATSQVNKVLANMQTQIFLTDPQQTTASNGMTYDAGSLVIASSALGGRGAIVEFGGAKAIAGSTMNIVYKPPPFTPPPVPPAPTGPSQPTGSGYLPPPVGGTSYPPTNPNPQTQPTSPSYTLAGFTVPRHPLSAGWIVFALLGSALIAFGLRRLPDRVLEAPSSTCTLDNQTQDK